MSDFNHPFWSIAIAALTLIGIVGCLVLLWLTAKDKSTNDPKLGTGHVWDQDLREMNNPLPLWWVGLFVITIVFSLVYLLEYPGLGAYKGLGNWSSTAEHKADVEQAQRELAPLYNKFTALPVQTLAGDSQAMAIGGRLFLANCAQCHGSDGRGSPGFPNLADQDWLWGGTPEKIKASITQGRVGAMPALGAAVGSSEDVKNLAHYVLSLSASPHDSVRAGLGRSKFSVCAACHGVDGSGNQELGAPNLRDKIWLHGWGEGAIINIVNNGKTNTMPAQRLSDAQIHLLSAYVWGLSNSANARQ